MTLEGARIQEGVSSLRWICRSFSKKCISFRSSPSNISNFGPCAGGAVYSPAMTDFIFMSDSSSYMFVTGPEVVKTVTHEEVTSEYLGGANNTCKKIWRSRLCI